MSQVKTRRVNLYTAIRSRAFRTGYEEVRQCKPLDCNRDWGQWRIAYEIGRQAAAHEIGLGDTPRRLPKSITLTEVHRLYCLAYQSQQPCSPPTTRERGAAV